MDPRYSSLIEAARAGNIEGLYSLIKEDASVLEPIEKMPFIDTPLHIAASEGQINFAMEMMNLKPSFARKLNQDGWSALHLAAKHRRSKLVTRLLEADKGLARVKGKEGMTPLHLVSIKGNEGLDLLFEILEACPECINDVTVNNDTALHLALKYDQIEAFNLLLGWLHNSIESALGWGPKIINWRDNDDNTLLHIAAKKKQRQALERLLWSYFRVDLKIRNSDGLTAFEIMEPGNVQNQSKSSCESETKYSKYLKRPNHWEELNAIYGRWKKSLSIDMINAMLVITALVITATYQSSLSPPGGVSQADNSPNSTTTHVDHYAAGDYNFFGRNNHFYYVKPKSPGTPVMDSTHFTGFWFMNSFTLWITISMTAWLLVPSFSLLLAPLSCLAACYHYSMVILSPSTAWAIINIFVMLLIGLLPTVFLSWPMLKAVLASQGDRAKFLHVVHEKSSFRSKLYGIYSRIVKFVCGEAKATNLPTTFRACFCGSS